MWKKYIIKAHIPQMCTSILKTFRPCMFYKRSFSDWAHFMIKGHFVTKFHSQLQWCIRYVSVFLFKPNVRAGIHHKQHWKWEWEAFLLSNCSRKWISFKFKEILMTKKVAKSHVIVIWQSLILLVVTLTWTIFTSFFFCMSSLSLK